MLGLRGRHQYSDQRSHRIKVPCVASTAGGTEGEEDQMARSSAQREQLTEEGREAGKSFIKRERKIQGQGQERILAGHLYQLKRNDFCDFDKPRKRVFWEEKIESNEQSKEGGQPK